MTKTRRWHRQTTACNFRSPTGTDVSVGHSERECSPVSQFPDSAKELRKVLDEKAKERSPVRSEPKIQRWITFDREWHKSDHGDWVQWDDVKELQARLSSLEALIQELPSIQHGSPNPSHFEATPLVRRNDVLALLRATPEPPK